MQFLIKKKPNELITPESINFTELIKNSNTITELNLQSEIINILMEEFTEPQQQLYLANLYMYLKFHPTNDFPINLENVFGMIGFANKGNAKKTLESNFTINEDYKITLVNTQKRKNEGGFNKENIMLNIETMKSLCMIAKTSQGKEMRKYYMKLENIHNKIIKKEIENTKILLQEKDDKVQVLEFNLETKQHKIDLLTRKTNKYEEGDSLYIFHSTIIDEFNKIIDLYKLGRTKNANTRDAVHKTASYKGILLQVTCVDSVLLERNVHFLLDKYRLAKRREWFSCSFDIVKNAIHYAKYVLESDINFENFNINNVIIPVIKKDEIIVKKEEQEEREIFTTLEYEKKDIDNFEFFINEYCDFNEDLSVSYIILKKQYKIWAKTGNHLQTKKLIDYVKTKYATFTSRHNPLVCTSTLTPHFKGLTLKESCYKFELPNNQNLIIENFLSQKCQRAPGFSVSMQNFYKEFEKFYTNDFIYMIKEKIKAFMDIYFVRSRTGDESEGTDNRLYGWAGVALKINDTPEPIKKYKPKNAKIILQKNINNDTIKTFNSLTDLAEFLQKSRTVTSNIVNSHKPIFINNVQYNFEFQ